ncbi:solute carrier family 39 (zinc transporter), member 1/2/3 [Angomonas deanei]|nr:solute carrier family 39 (zinc transporter), member 1/2/3 [Angomonas deanei]EPY43509.1 solute carrier family 39 (zinc transporter), member 1/2/3 [Angomonas deanei]|eukprot:EPY31195.1 solute carrier family 39 (zinc transporter), member 1/2/3 [Angomonas deanei]
MLAVALIHMINHAASVFEEDCIPQSFAKQFEGWAFLFAMIAAIFMHFVDTVIAAVTEDWAMKKARLEREAQSEAGPGAVTECPCGEQKCEAGVQPCAEPAVLDGDSDHTGHSHGLVVPDHMSSVQRVVAAISMEFGVTLHSVFVGLTLGVTNDSDLRGLLVALVFHQLFEGVAMGSRLADAEFNLLLEIILTCVFSFSAPIGIAAGTAAVSSSADALASSTYAMVSGIFDSLCGGILLYLAFGLIFVDFPADLRRYCAAGSHHRKWRILGMFLSLWIGAGVMALIGKWL